MSSQVILGDVLEALRGMADNSMDACLSDVPYGLGSRDPSVDEIVAYLRGESGLDTGGDFMGKDWQIPSVAFWRELYRVLKPGAHILIFAGTRTVDLILVGIRAGGFQLRDTIGNAKPANEAPLLAWTYASGFPKSLDLAKAADKSKGHWRGRAGKVKIAKQSSKGTEYERAEKGAPVTAAAAALRGWGTALKPAWEPIIMARKPPEGTVAANAFEYGTGGINVDGCRIGYASEDDKAVAAAGAAAQRLVHTHHGAGVGENGLHGANAADSLQPYLDNQAMGRWPANMTLQHSDGCRVVGHARSVRPIMGNVEGGAVKAIGFTRGSVGQTKRAEVAEVYSCVDGCPVRILDEQSGDRPGMSGGGTHRDGYGGGMFGGIDSASTARGDNGGASRFYFVAKASRGERELGCEHLPARTGGEATGREDGAAGTVHARSGAGGGADLVHNHGPCVKPIKLTRWLATMLLPPPQAHRARRLVVPYCGTGGEIIGALRAGWEEVVGIEREAEYAAIARARIERWSQVPAGMDEAEVCAAAEKPDERQMGLFGGGR